MTHQEKDLNRYAYLSSDPTQTDEEDTEMLRLQEELTRAGVDLGLPPMARQRYTREQLTASDGRVWTQKEVEMMAQWWEAKLSEMRDIEAVMNACEGFGKWAWLDFDDPPAVDLERERLRTERYASS